MKVQRVFKYATGYDNIPKGAKYLCTQVEQEIEKTTQPTLVDKRLAEWHRNQFVWHYFLVEIEESEAPPARR